MIEFLVFLVLTFRRNRKILIEHKVHDYLIYTLILLISFILFVYFFAQLRTEWFYFRKDGISGLVTRYKSSDLPNFWLNVINTTYLLTCVYSSALLLSIGQFKEQGRKLFVKLLIPTWLTSSGYFYMYVLAEGNYSSFFVVMLVLAIPFILIYLFFKMKRVQKVFYDANA